MNKKGNVLLYGIITIAVLIFIMLFIKPLFDNIINWLFLSQIKWGYLILGLIIVIIFAQIIPSLLLEVLLFGGILGFIEVWKYWGVVSLGLPSMPEWIYATSAGIMLSWSILRLLFVFSNLWIPQLTPLTQMIFRNTR